MQLHSFFRGITALLLLASFVRAEDYYNEPFRPQYHFTPAENFMNDPNGMVYYRGEYHLFYQHNPFGNTWGHMSWGHAVSRDLVHWEHRPVALKEENDIMIFSGSAVVDRKNTSGFGRKLGWDSPMVAIYTGHYTKANGGLQNQHIAYSLDRGRTWTKYSGNPVLDIGKADFRDPKVFWHDKTRRWIMVVALPHEHKVQFYTSPDLKAWELAGDFGPAGATAGIWECPDLFEVPIENSRGKTRWVLIVNLNPGGIAGGSGSQYFIGDFDGKTFRNDYDAAKVLWTDYGKDFYAAVTWSNVPKTDGRRILLGWMSNWQYANEIPTSPWRSAQSLPRALTLRNSGTNLVLIQKPVKELQKLRTQSIQVNPQTVSPTERFLAPLQFHGDTYEIETEIEPGNATEVGFKLRQGTDEETVLTYRASDATLLLDRTKSGQTRFSSHFPGAFSAGLPTKEGRIKLHLFVDRSSVEVFGNDGELAFTNQIFPGPESDGLEMFVRGGKARLHKLSIWKLRSAWAAPKNSDEARAAQDATLPPNR